MRFFIRQEEEYIDAECYDLMYKDFKGLGCTFNEITKGKTTYVVLKLVNRIIRRLAGY